MSPASRNRLDCHSSVTFHDPTRLVIVEGRYLLCSPHEYAVLRHLATRAPGVVCDRHTLQACLYPPPRTYPDSRVLEVVICRLRRKLLACGARGEIQTVRRHGYQWVDAVTTQSGKRVPPPVMAPGAASLTGSQPGRPAASLAEAKCQ
jgi:DNA-binding response OmpR family regulator